jgi:hypothetical protein
LKIFYKISAVLLLSVTIFTGMFFFDAGRRALLDLAGIFVRICGAELVVDGVKGQRIQTIHTRFRDGTELTFYDTVFWKGNFSDGISIESEKFVLKTTRDENSDLNPDFIRRVLSAAATARFFVKSLFVKTGTVYVGSETYSPEALCYKFENRTLMFSCQTDKTSLLNIALERGDGEWTLGRVLFESTEKAGGILSVQYPERKTAKYKLDLRIGRFKVASEGCWEDFMSEVRVEAAGLEYGGRVYNFSGSLYPAKCGVSLEVCIDPERLPGFAALPQVIAENFKGVSGRLRLEGDFRKKFRCRGDFVLEKFGTRIGNLSCKFDNNAGSIVGDISRIKIGRFDFSSLICEIKDKESAEITLLGKEFKIFANLKSKDRILAEKLELRVPGGFLKLSEPFLIAPESSGSFDFNFDGPVFSDVRIFGVGSGSFAFGKNKISAQGSCKKLKLNDHRFYSTKVFLENDVFRITSEGAKIFGMRLKNAKLEKTGEKIDLSAEVNATGILKASGKVSEDFRKISTEEGRITFPQQEIRLEECLLDAKVDNCRVRCSVYDLKKDKKHGDADLRLIGGEAVCAFNAFPVSRIAHLFNCNIPSCLLSGELKLKSDGEFLAGGGKLRISNLAAHMREIETDWNISRKGIKIDAELKDPQDQFNVSAFLPAVLKSSGRFRENPHDNALDCRLKANVLLERVLELPDNSDLRGRFLCDCRITGSLSDPKVFGNAALRDAGITVGDVLLQNGTISLIGDGKHGVKLLTAEFVDRHGKKTTASGGGRLFFNGIIPNIDLDLNLRFDNFILFDADDLKIEIKGNGSMKGPINDLTVAGNITIPKCEVQNFSSEENLATAGITVENDPYLRIRKKDQDEGDFLKYDIYMHCHDVKFVGDIFEMHLKGDLRLKTEEKKKTFTGELKLFDGKLDLFGKRMKFVRGKAIFLKDFLFDPEAYFTCQRNFGEISVELNIKNVPNKGMSLDLHSSPAYTQDVILSKMLFDKDSRNLTMGEAAQLAHAVAGLNSKGYIFSVLNMLRDTGVVDRISFIGAEDVKSDSLYANFQNASSDNTGVSAGKYIHDNIYISVNKKKEIMSFDIDVSLTPKISVKASSDGEAGISWKYRY